MLLTLVSLILSQGPVTDIPAVGPHYTVLRVEKNENSQNVMMIYTKLDSSCLLESGGDNASEPVFGFYWLMNGKTYKPVNPMIAKAIRDNFPVDHDSIKQDSYSVEFTELAKLNDDLPAHRISVEAEKTKSGCDAAAFITLGPSDGGARIRLTSIYSEAHFSLSSPPAFRKLDAVTLRGIDVATGKDISHRYPAK